jgi:hypothetical protein
MKQTLAATCGVLVLAVAPASAWAGQEATVDQTGTSTAATTVLSPVNSSTGGSANQRNAALATSKTTNKGSIDQGCKRDCDQTATVRQVGSADSLADVFEPQNTTGGGQATQHNVSRSTAKTKNKAKVKQRDP